MHLIKIAVTGLFVFAAGASMAQTAPARPMPGATSTPPSAPMTIPTNTVMMQAVPLQISSATEMAIQKLTNELAQIKKDQAAEIAALKAQLTAESDKLAALKSTYESHTHNVRKVSFGVLPKKATCYGGCGNDIFYESTTHSVSVSEVSKPHTSTGLWDQ